MCEPPRLEALREIVKDHTADTCGDALTPVLEDRAAMSSLLEHRRSQILLAALDTEPRMAQFSYFVRVATAQAAGLVVVARHFA